MAVVHAGDDGDHALVEKGVGKGGQRWRGGKGSQCAGDVEFVAGELEKEVWGDICVDGGGNGDDLKTGGEGKRGGVGLLNESGTVEKGNQSRLLAEEEWGMVRTLLRLLLRLG